MTGDRAQEGRGTGYALFYPPISLRIPRAILMRRAAQAPWSPSGSLHFTIHTVRCRLPLCRFGQAV
jgi:hypothetical protein